MRKPAQPNWGWGGRVEERAQRLAKEMAKGLETKHGPVKRYSREEIERLERERGIR